MGEAGTRDQFYINKILYITVVEENPNVDRKKMENGGKSERGQSKRFSDGPGVWISGRKEEAAVLEGWRGEERKGEEPRINEE